jgi:ABC-type transporter Mla maintaining outer membrane lipid asymmetry ATPase subunit MlaF
MLLVVGAYANIGIMFVLSLFAQLISEDIRIGLDRQFLLMGVPSTIYWFHYFIVYTIENIVTATFYTIISYMIFLNDCNFGLLLLNYIIAFSAISSLIVILPTVVKQPDAIQVVPYMLILGSIITWTIIIYLVKDPTNIIITLFSLLNPIWGMQQLLASYYSFSGAGLGIGVTTIMEWWECGAGPCFFAQIGNIVLYLGIIHYKNRPQRGTIPPASDEDKQSALTPSKYIQSIPAERNESDVAFCVTGLRKEFVIGGSGKTKKTIKAVNGLNMTVKKGEVYGFLGHNGAEKSSALSLLAGEMLPTSGEAVFHFDNHHDGTTTAESLLPIAQGHEEEIRSRLGFCPQHDILFPNLSCRQHLELFSRLKGGLAYEGQSEEDSIRTEVETRLDEINFPAVEDNDKPCGTLSGGMKRKVSLALALIGDPTVVFLDEPTSGTLLYVAAVV